MTIQEILEAHLNWYFPDASSNQTRCLCGQVISVGDGAQKLRMGEQAAFAHVAEVLEQHMQAREAKAKAEALRDAAGIVHSEARWQWELHQRHSMGAQLVAQRMTVIEEVLTNRANQRREGTNG